MQIVRQIASAALAACVALPVLAQEDAGGSAARALQDPLANISALLTDNTVIFNQGPNKDRTGYDFQLQPVYSIPTDMGFNFVPRAVVPLLGQPQAGGSTTWGLGDIIVQGFVSPKSESSIKWGIGPQVSLKTRTDSGLTGPGWGAGLAGVIVATDTGNWSLAGIVNHLWGENGFSVTTLNPVVYYNFPNTNGWFAAYNNSIAYDWKAVGGQEWTVPVGVTIGKAIELNGGYGLELSLGGYRLVEAPTGAGDSQLKFGISVVFPR